jgi:hypothetical protein
MNRVRLYVLVSIALAVAVLLPWLGTHAQTQANPKNLSTNYVLFNRVWVKLIQIMVSEEVGQSS